jgi:hypothetical protein
VTVLNARELFARYLDLAPLRGRSRGKVRCVFHQPDRRPSLDVDLERGLFICRSCGASGGLRRFAALVGEPTTTTTARREVPARRRSVIEEARAEALAAARRQPWARAGVAELYAASDWVRDQRRIIDHARRAATAEGPTVRTWRVLRAAADCERRVREVEVLLDLIVTVMP